jgi:uncharacterized protein (DUF1800 family)
MPTFVRLLNVARPMGIARIGSMAGIGGIAAVLVLGAVGCATHPTGAQAKLARPDAAAGVLPLLHREDVLWLGRVSFGLDAASVADYRRLGREKFLERQLHPRGPALPEPVAVRLAAADPGAGAAGEEMRGDAAARIAAVNAARKSIYALPEGSEREAARKAMNDRGNRVAYAAIRRELLRAVYSQDQLEEQMVWFWLNHFNVYQHKAEIRWVIGDYAEVAIRPHALGLFRDLVLATLEHPAMLQYLDNQQNAAGHVNENYARELLELHTLGVNGGYTQQDVQQLALVLTGAGIAGENPPKLKPELQGFYVRRGAFEFNPARHDFSRKTLLGRSIPGEGFAEIEAAVDLLTRQPACARFIAGELARYFVADDPPPALVDRMAQTFMRTNGDMAAVLRTLFLARELDAALGSKFKDPMRFVVSAVRFAYDGPVITNTRPLLNWLNSLGEAPFGHQTPDGYPMTELNWASAGQMSRRFEIARSIGSGSAGLFDADDGSAKGESGFPQLSNRLFFEAVEPFLTANTRNALGRASSQQEWNLFLLSSPDFSYE